MEIRTPSGRPGLDPPAEQSAVEGAGARHIDDTYLKNVGSPVMGSPFVDASVRAPAPIVKLILLGRGAMLLEKIDPDRHPFLSPSPGAEGD